MASTKLLACMCVLKVFVKAVKEGCHSFLRSGCQLQQTVFQFNSPRAVP